MCLSFGFGLLVSPAKFTNSTLSALIEGVFPTFRTFMPKFPAYVTFGFPFEMTFCHDMIVVPAYSTVFLPLETASGCVSEVPRAVLIFVSFKLLDQERHKLLNGHCLGLLIALGPSLVSEVGCREAFPRTWEGCDQNGFEFEVVNDMAGEGKTFPHETHIIEVRWDVGVFPGFSAIEHLLGR